MKKSIQLCLLILATATGILYGTSSPQKVSDTCREEWQVVLRKHNPPIYAGTSKHKIHYSSVRDSMTILK